MEYPKLRIDCRPEGKITSSSIVLDGKELSGITHIKIDIPECSKAPILTLEIDVNAFQRNEIPDYME